MSRQSSLWIDRENGRDPDAGPFSSARWRRQALEAEELGGPDGEGPGPEPSSEPPRRRRLLPAAAFVVALLALGVSLGGLLLDRGNEPSRSSASLAAPGGRLAPTQIGRVYDSAGPGVVRVQAGSATGTGFVVRDDGTIVTNAHVVGDAQTAEVQFADKGGLLNADVLGSDRSSDLAVLRVDPGSVQLKALPLADSSKVEVGDAVVAIGHPFGLERTTTAGIVSGLERQIQAPNGFEIDKVIQTDAAINPGNSGGPLLDSRGRVIGVNSQIATGGSGRGNVGVGFAVPSNTVREVLPALSRGQRIERPFLGVTTAAHPDGAEIVSVTAGSPAEDAGLQPGEVIRRVDGHAVSSPDDVAQAISADKPGDTVEVELTGGAQDRTVDVQLGTRP